MKNFMKGKMKRFLAGTLSFLMLAGSVPTTAMAATNKVSMSFGPAYESNGTLICYQGSFTSPSGLTDGVAGHRKVIIYGNGEEAYCIQPGKPLNTGDELTANASDAWNALSSAKKKAVKLALAYGKPGNSQGLSGSSDAKYIATQMVVWEFVNGWRNTSSYERTNNSIYEALCKNGANPEVAESYKQIIAAMQKHDVVPSFANGKTYDMNFQNGQYTLTLKDANKVLTNYKVNCSDENIKVVKEGNNLKLVSNAVINKDVKITFTKTSSISSSAKLVAYGSASQQDTIIGVERPDDVVATCKVSTPAGTMKLVKTSEDGIVEGIQFEISGNGIAKTVKTEKDGAISISGLYPGTYTVTEKVADYYEPQKVQTVTIKAGETSTVKFANILKRGDLSVTKTSEDGFSSGMKFHLYGKSASGIEVNEYATTDKNGVATFRNILIAGASGYTMEEVETAVRYVIPDAQNVKIFWNDVTNTTVQNILKKFNVTVKKVDAEKTKSQGDATLAGAVYGLYKGGELVESMTTDESGSFTTGYHVCGDDWTIREITPSEGYLLDGTTYTVGAEAKNYTVEFNSAPAIESPEQVIKGQISIIKHTDDGSTQIETPEEGATFEVYLTSTGSYENARETERDTLVCNQDGFAISKELPYGIYTVHQTVGAEETELMKDFTVFISQDGQTYKYLMNNAPYSAYLKVVKADKETGVTIPLSGAGFEIYNEAGEKVTMSYTYPTLTTIDTYYVSEDGYLITPQVLAAGKYTLVEVQAPYGYVLDSTPIPFKVTRTENEDVSGLNVITVTAYDQAQKGKITVTKTGEGFISVTVSGEGTETADPIYQPVYENIALAGAEYEIVAVEDIYTGDGTLRYKEGTVVDQIITDENGAATTKEVYLGKYQVIETKAPEGYVLNSTPADVELVYAGQEVSVTDAATCFENERQKIQLNAVKTMEQDEIFQIGTNEEITAVSFGLYAKEEIQAADGSTIPAEGLIELAFCDKDGNISFQSDLPFGSYYVKEVSTDPHYIMSDTEYEFVFSYAGQEKSVVTVELNDKKAIENKLKRGKIEGYKMDGEENGLAGATFGLFNDWTKEYSLENAYLTTTSDEKGYFEFQNVPYGDYVVVELEAPEGYVASDARHFVSVTYDTQVIGLKAINYQIVGSVQLTKVDKEYPENHLSGAVFEVFADVDNDGVLDEKVDKCLGELKEVNEGIYEMDGLFYGSYLIKETKAPEGFLLDENVYPFSIAKDGETVVIENEVGVGFINQPIRGEITVFKIDKETGEKLVGAGFRVCDADGKVVAEGYTDETGMVTFSLRYGEYTVAEFDAPKGYVLDETPYAFSVIKDGQKISVDMANTKIRGKLVISKVDADTEELLPGAGFRIYDMNGKVIKEGYTDKKGNVEFDLEFGTYYYQEFDAPDGYDVDNTKYEFSITEDGKVISVIMTNKKTPTETLKKDTPEETTKKPLVSTDGPKTGDESNIALWGVLAGIAVMAGVGLMVFSFRKQNRKKEK